MFFYAEIGKLSPGLSLELCVQLLLLLHSLFFVTRWRVRPTDLLPSCRGNETALLQDAHITTHASRNPCPHHSHHPPPPQYTPSSPPNNHAHLHHHHHHPHHFNTLQYHSSGGSTANNLNHSNCLHHQSTNCLNQSLSHLNQLTEQFGNEITTSYSNHISHHASSTQLNQLNNIGTAGGGGGAHIPHPIYWLQHRPKHHSPTSFFSSQTPSFGSKRFQQQCQ